MELKFKISSIFGGWSVSDYFNQRGQFLSSLGIDPDMPSDDDGNKASGFIRPVAYEKFSGANVDSTPLFILTNPKSGTIYVLLANGKLISYSSVPSHEAVAATLTGNVGKGAAYYDNYFYLARETDIARFGPLNGTAAITQSYWQTTLSLTALTNTSYPSINGVKIPNHQMHKHTDNKLYICDVLSSNKGALHAIKTTKTTVEGDTDDGSEHNVLDFPYGVYPIQCETYQSDLAVILVEGVERSMMRGRLSFWDTTSSSYTQITSVETENEKEIFTAMKNVNGVLYVFSGIMWGLTGYATQKGGGLRVSKVVSGYQLEEVAYFPEEFPPLSRGAVDSIINRIIWGSNTIEPTTAGTVFAIGAKEKSLSIGIHSIARAPVTGDNPQVTAVKYVDANGKIRQPWIGYKSDSEYGLAKVGTTYQTSILRTEVVIPESYGDKFTLKSLKFPFTKAIEAGMEATIYLYADNALDSRTFTIGNTAHSGKKSVTIYPEIEMSNNFFIEIRITGTVLFTFALPILGVIDIRRDI